MSKINLEVKGYSVNLSGSDIAAMRLLKKEDGARFAHLNNDGIDLATQGLIRKRSAYRGSLTRLGRHVLDQIGEEEVL